MTIQQTSDKTHKNKLFYKFLQNKTEICRTPHAASD